MINYEVDVAVIGGGPAGLAAAISAHENGAKKLNYISLFLFHMSMEASTPLRRTSVSFIVSIFLFSIIVFPSTSTVSTSPPLPFDTIWE